MATCRKFILLCLYVMLVGIAAQSDSDEPNDEPCNLREFETGFVCVCNITHCDFLAEDVDNPKDAEIIIITSSENGLRFDVNKFPWPTDSPSRINIRDYAAKSEPEVLRVGQRPLFGSTINWIRGNDKVKIDVDPSTRYQKILGFGGAFTGAVSHNLDQMSEQMQEALYKIYYSKQGIGYNFMRIPIGGCDFDKEAWAYNEHPEDDVNLSNFTALDPRDLKLVEKIKKLKEVSSNSDIKILASAWSPPPWMKTNNKWTGASALREEYYQTWADYHVKFIELMAENGVDLWGITTGNEPMNGVIGWLFVHFMSLGWIASNQGVWVADHLAPALKKSSSSKVKILAGDDQRYTFPWWFRDMDSKRPNVTDELFGFAVHWYWDKFFPPELLDITHREYPDKVILNTESCLGDKPLQTHGPILGSWSRAEEYIHAYIQDFKHSVNGWIDWNLLLDENGGPNYVSNHVDSPVIVNPTSNEAYKQPLFYAIGHFSRFIPENSVRIGLTIDNKNVDGVGFLRPDKKIVLVLYNKSKLTIYATLNVPQQQPITLPFPPKAIHTLIFTQP